MHLSPVSLLLESISATVVDADLLLAVLMGTITVVDAVFIFLRCCCCGGGGEDGGDGG